MYYKEKNIGPTRVSTLEMNGMTGQEFSTKVLLPLQTVHVKYKASDAALVVKALKEMIVQVEAAQKHSLAKAKLEKG